MILNKVVSGAQSGVDQAALKVASDRGYTVGGFCPKGGLDEFGKNMLVEYPTLREATTSIPDERTKLNVLHSSGTLIIVPKWPLPEKDGTHLTIKEAERLNKPCLIISLLDDNITDTIKEWVDEKNIEVLNIAGPRESSCPGINHKTCEILEEFFVSLQPRARI